MAQTRRKVNLNSKIGKKIPNIDFERYFRLIIALLDCIRVLSQSISMNPLIKMRCFQVFRVMSKL